MKTLFCSTLVTIGVLCTPFKVSSGFLAEREEVNLELAKVQVIEFQDDLFTFLDALAFQESSNRYDVVNRYGYMGKYQFGMSTLRGLGYNVSRKEFLNSPDLQEQAMLKLLDHNRHILRRYIKQYDGTYVHGIRLTESGILAAAHLVGPTKVKSFIYTGYVAVDGNNVPMTSYLIKFQGYNLDSDAFLDRSEYLLASR